jgi:hypothetical protein
MFVAIHWIEDVTVLDKFREYYIRTFSINIMPAFTVATISTIVISFRNTNRS